MASTFIDMNFTFQRSISSSNIPDLTLHDFRESEASNLPEELPRSASYTNIPVHESKSYNAKTERNSAGEAKDSSRSGEYKSLKRADSEKPKTKLVEEELPDLERLGRRKSLVSRPKSWLQRNKPSPERKSLDVPIVAPVFPVPVISSSPSKKKLSGSLASFARNTWISASRSPSPSNRATKLDDSSLNDDDSTAASSISSSSPRKSPAIVTLLPKSEKKTLAQSPKGDKRGFVLKKGKRRQSDLINVVEFSSHDTLRGNLSRTSLEKPVTPPGLTEIPPVPKTFTKEKLASFGIEPGRRKDELWSAFRSLDTDYSKFHTKSSALKTNVVRATILPFLRNYAQHPSNKTVRPEDIDRRVTILNKWWTGILEMLDGHNNQYVSGIDRPVLLEAITGIMIRPEWRLAPSYFAPLVDRTPSSPLPRSISTNSVDSSASQFLAESVYHNVRNMFVQNLLSQMSMVVNKMSLRNAPASLVTFCGKAAAYAFFFCPGVAEVLVKVWNIPKETIRRASDEFGIPRRYTGGTDEVVLEFPPNIQELGFTSTKGLSNILLRKANLPLGASKIDWYGPWTARWCGRDSDLFFVFCKHYLILTDEFLPRGFPLLRKARAPGFVLVHAQILVVMDSTIHRQSSGDAANGSIPVTFDDVMSGADASAATLPLPPASNVARLMAENRLLALLRDFVSDRTTDIGLARHTFAESFGCVMRAAAKKTSQFDHDACFILCDFMEEALSIYIEFQNSLESQYEYIDWRFWLLVCRKMLDSQNSMTEIRLFSLVFSSWNMIIADEERKNVLCLDWLLSEETFQTYFLHWCPMVRAYYMRLLCWRICRFDGDASDLDTSILTTMYDRLKTVWSQYLYEKQLSESNNKLPHSTAPCHPAPGRRLLIIRNDSQSPTASLFLGFDGIVQSGGSQQTPSKRSSIIGMAHSNSIDFNLDPETSPSQRKRWSLLGKIMPFNNMDGPVHVDVPSNSNQKLEQVRQATAFERAKRPSLQSTHKSSSSSLSSDSPSAPSTPTHRPFSFKFSLEWMPPSINTVHHNNSLAPGRDRRLSPPRLPAQTHTWLVSQVPGTADEISTKIPVRAEVKYSGRALAEWTLIIMEYNNFIERRKAEGVPSLKLLEVPTLGVEGFRKFG